MNEDVVLFFLSFGMYVLLCLDSRFVGCLPSVLATATMLHVIDQIKHNGGMEYKNQLLSVLKISKVSVYIRMSKYYLFIYH